MFSKVLLQKVSSGFIEISSCLRSVIGRVGNKDEFRSFQGAIRSPNLIAPHRNIYQCDFRVVASVCDSYW